MSARIRSRWLVAAFAGGGVVFMLASPVYAQDMHHRGPEIQPRSPVPVKPTLPDIKKVTRGTEQPARSVGASEEIDGFREESRRIEALNARRYAEWHLRRDEEWYQKTGEKFLKDKATMQEVIEAGGDVKRARQEVEKAKKEHDRLRSYEKEVSDFIDAEARLSNVKLTLTTIGLAPDARFTLPEDRQKQFENVKRWVEKAQKEVDEAKKKVREAKAKAGVSDGKPGTAASTGDGTGKPGGAAAGEGKGTSRAATASENDVSGLWITDEKSGTQTQTFDDGSSRTWTFDGSQGMWVPQSPGSGGK